MNQEPLVSIIINNYNYGQFLEDAIGSALRQTYPKVEVIVVDDGSTDSSHTVIAGYEKQIIPVLKTNGGQGSAFNAGFVRSRGQVIIFLDSDDMLLPNIAKRVALVFQSDPRIAEVRYRLEVIDASGIPLGLLKPPRHIPMLNGDLRHQILRSPDDITWQAGSGNAFAAQVLRQIFPVPEDDYRVGADAYVTKLSALFGTVVSLEEVGGYYRIHDLNDHNISRKNLHRIQQIIQRIRKTHEYIWEFADLLDLEKGSQTDSHTQSVRYLAIRMTSLKLDPHGHPIPEDTISRLLFSGITASLHRSDLPMHVRLVHLAWFIAMVPAPEPLAWWLVDKFFHPERRRRVTNLLGFFKRS